MQMVLIQWLEEVETSIYGRTGLVNSKPVKIRIRDDVIAYSIYTARWIPSPLLPKVKKETKRMKEIDII